MAGAVMQKYIGVGNILRTVGIPYPTTEVPVTANTLPIAEIPKMNQGQF